jgi:hypothetical protein
MKRVFIGILLLVSSLTALAQTVPQPTRRTMTVGEVATYLLSLQPKAPTNSSTRLVVIAPFLHPSLSSSFDALVHGWCENPFFFSCSPAHYPISVTIITGASTVEWFRVPATPKTLALPGGVSQHAAPMWMLKDAPKKGVWLVLTPRLEDEAVLIGGLLDGSSATAELVNAPGLASAMYKQLFVETLIAQATRWNP